MRIAVMLAGVSLSVCATGANANPGSNLLTTGSKGPQTSMSGGVTFEELNGVNIYRGGGAKQDLLGADEPDATDARTEIEIIIAERPWRRIRRLRTQGFYSGVAYPSRPYTQGFYSTGR